MNPGSQRFFKMDLISGYHQVELSQEAGKYLNFILPQGRFTYCVAPMGFVSSGDWFNLLTDRVMKNTIAGVQKEVDDILGQCCTSRTTQVSAAEVSRQQHHPLQEEDGGGR